MPTALPRSDNWAGDSAEWSEVMPKSSPDAHVSRETCAKAKILALNRRRDSARTAIHRKRRAERPLRTRSHCLPQRRGRAKNAKMPRFETLCGGIRTRVRMPRGDWRGLCGVKFAWGSKAAAAACLHGPCKRPQNHESRDAPVKPGHERVLRRDTVRPVQPWGTMRSRVEVDTYGPECRNRRGHAMPTERFT